MYCDATNVKDADAYAAAIKRIYEVTGCANMDDLSAYFNASLGTISDARRRKRVNVHFLLILLFQKGINPAWILTGEGAKYLTPSHVANVEPLLEVGLFQENTDNFA